MRSLSLNGSNNDSLLDGITWETARELIEKTDETLVKKRKNKPREHNDLESELNSARVKGELASYAYPLSVDEKLRDVQRFGADWEPYFNHPLYQDHVEVGDVGSVPEHPWMTLKSARQDQGGANNLSKGSRYALRVVKTFYAEKWRGLG